MTQDRDTAGREPIEELDDNLPDLVIPKTRQQMITETGVIEVELREPPVPPPVYHDTDIENVVDSDAAIATTVLRNLTKSWKAVRTVQEASGLALATCRVMEHRRKLANKQLGFAEGALGSKGMFHVPD